MAFSINVTFFFLLLQLFKFQSTVQYSPEESTECQYKTVTISKPDLNEDAISDLKSYGHIWFRGSHSTKQLVIWVDEKRLSDLTTKLERDGIQYLVSVQPLCNYPRQNQEILPLNDDSILETPRELNFKTRRQTGDDGLVSVVHHPVIDYGDGSIYTNLFYSLKVVVSSETKRFALGKGNVFILGSVKSKKGLWAFEKSETDGLYILRNRAVLKQSEVVFDKNCFRYEAQKPCLTFSPYTSPGDPSSQLRFKLTTTDSTGINIYATDGNTENCLEYTEHQSGLIQIVLSDDNQNCATFIPTLKAEIHSDSYFNVSNQQDNEAATLFVAHDEFIDQVENATVYLSSCFQNANDFKDVAVVASYTDAEPSKSLYKNLVNVVSNFFPEAGECVLMEGETELQCKYNQHLRNKVIYTTPASKVFIDRFISIYDTMEFEFLETVKAYIIAEIFIPCDDNPCTRVLKARLPEDLVDAIVSTQVIKSRTGTVKLAKAMVFEHRVVDENSNTDPPEVCTE